ncbi:MAG: right-handed parallel beta-helix repeat-containing protein, partial [Candidatus Eisenbacteria sp.]|nr:right-handed parallel beta-helix repeat-containing protein [Candidatus Eisenbacteria bacterium]
MNSRSRFGAASAGLASVACLLALVLGSNLALAGTFTPVTVTDQTPTAPLANPTPSSYQPRYISGFGLDNSFTVFFEDRDAGYTVSYNSTSIGPTGFSASNTASTIAPETHFCVKPWPINVGGTDYDYRAWGAVGNNMDHRFYVSNDMVNWTLVSTFTISNDAGWGGARGWVYYGFHDVILINGTYYAFAESNQSQTMLCRSANGDDVWEAFASLGGSQAGDGPLQLPVGISYGWTPTGNFLDLGYDRGYGKVYAHPGDSDFYLAVNTAAQASMAPATLEAAFINPTNWSWHDGTTGPAANAILSETVEHDLRECWVVPNSDPGDDWVIIYDADFGAGDGGKALGYATLTPPAGPKVHNITQGTDHNTIQEGIDAAIAGDVIEVDAGMYREQLYIDKTLNLTGAGIGSSIIEAPDPGDRTSYSITQWTGSTRNIDAVIGVDDAGTVNISGFTVDGRNTGPDNFYGIHFYNTDGSVTHCQIEDITYPASPGAQKVVSVVATHGLGETISIDFSDNEIPNLQKGGILLMGPGCTFTVDRNAVTDSESDDIAGNGIQLSYGATGTTEDNVVQGVGYSGTDWAGTGILLFESGSISMDGDEVFDCEGAVNFSDWGWIYLHPVPVNLGFANLNLHDNEWTLGAQLSRDNSDPTITITDCTINNSAGDGIDVYGTGMDPWGGSYYTGWENGDLILTITGCLISNTTGYDGLWTHDLSGNTTNNSTLNVNYNSFVNHADYAVNHNLPETMDATNCWWGDPTGPSTTKRGGGESQAIAMVQPYGCNLPTKGHALAKPVSNAKTGGSIHGSIDYVPFLTGDIICVPDPQEISLADAGYQDDVDVHYLGGSGAVYGYSIEVQWDSTVVVGSFSKPASGPFQTAQFFQVIPFDASHVRVDCALGGAGAGTLGPDDLFKCTFTAVGTPDYATTSVDLTILSLRDNNNQPLTAYVDNGEVIVDLVGPSVTNVLITNTTLTHTNDYIKDSDNAHVYANVTDGGPGVTVTANLSGLGGGALVAPGSFDSGDADWDYTVNTGSAVESNVNVTVTATDDLGNSSSASDVDGIMLDNIAPTAITGFNAEPHHERVALSWDNPSGLDTYYYGVVVRFDSSSVYPVYGSPGIYPADESGGDGDAYNNTGAVTGGDHTVSNPRSIYYYTAFAYDWAM